MAAVTPTAYTQYPRDNNRKGGRGGRQRFGIASKLSTKRFTARKTPYDRGRRLRVYIYPAEDYYVPDRHCNGAAARTGISRGYYPEKVFSFFFFFPPKSSGARDAGATGGVITKFYTLPKRIFRRRCFDV